MAALKIHLADDLRTRIEARAVENGFENVEAYIEAMVVADAGAPVLDDEQVEPLLATRLEGPFVKCDETDFQRMRRKLRGRIEGSEGAEPKS
jgi:hypothetical protein